MTTAEIIYLTILIVFIINFFMILFLVFLERKDPKSILPWIFAFLAFPILSWIIYFFVGKGPKINRKRWSRRKKIADNMIAHEFAYGNLKSYESDDREIRELIKLNSNEYLQCTTYNETKIYTDAHEMYEDQIKDIKEAKETVFVLYYLFKKDDAGRRFLDAMTEKAKEGLKVILVFDDSGNPKTTYSFLRKFIKAGGIVRPFFPSHFTLINHNFAYRNHRKIVVIDNKIGYVGGMNIGVDYLSQDKKIKPWRDTHLRIVGEAVSLLQVRFLQDFSYSDHNKISKKNKMSSSEIFKAVKYFEKNIKEKTEHVNPIQIVSSGPDSDKEEIKRSYLKMISIAHHTIYLETPYFIPDKSFIDALLIAKSSGVDINLVIPGVPDKKTVYHVTYSYLEELLKAGINVYLYPGFIHSKMVVCDDRVASIGTANLDVRSFSMNFEVIALMFGKKEVIETIQIAVNDISKSHKLTYLEYKNRPKKDKIQEHLFRLCAPLM